MMRLLITGGSGFIGRNLVEDLASTYEVLTPSSEELNLLRAQDVRDYLNAHRVDVVVHAATTRSNRRVTAPSDLIDRNCRMFFNLARNHERFGKMIVFGSGAQYGDRTQLPAQVGESYFDTRVPVDPYGFSKYVCAKYIEHSNRILDLRLFAVFGPHEDYTVRFISNACCRVLKGLPIVLRQDVAFDYLYVKDLVRITRWFIENDARYRAYNVCSGTPVTLRELARIVAEIAGSNPPVSFLTPGMGAAYTADNSRLLAEMRGYQFWELHRAVGELYSWYKEHESEVDEDGLRFEEKNKMGARQ